MKIGTDSVLIGSWTSLEKNPINILDIGSGTGVLALIMAQRSQAEQIDAIEIDDMTFEQCVENFENSPWSDRLFCYHASLQEFAEEIDETYDLIISNPPYYSEDYKSKNMQRDIARFQDALPFDHLLSCSANLLSEHGILSVVIPFKEEEHFIKLAAQANLFPKRILHVKGNPSSKVVRSLIEFSIINSNVKMEEMVIETTRHQYTKEYINLTKDFYLKM